MQGQNNIYLGTCIGQTDESYQFRLRLSAGGKEYKTEMTPEEYKNIKSVLQRAMKETNNGI